MNLKKLFATSAILTLAVSTFAPAINSAKADYNAEMKSAYDYAYAKNVTTLPTIEAAYPMGKAIRAHTAKMISNWALAVLNRQPNEAINPVFTDIAGESEEMQGYIKKAAQQGLMGQGIEKFMPQQDVTRAQFGTVLSRALFGDKYDGGTPYYAKHLENLKKLGIMNDLNNPERPVLRYEIWLMLQRAEKLTTKEDSEGLTPEQILGCLAADDYLACIGKAKGDEKKEDKKEDNKKDEVVRDGDLNVSVVDYSKSVKSAPSKGTLIFNQVELKASKKVTVDSITLERIGLSNRSDVRAVWFEKDGIAVSSRGSINSDGTATVRFYRGFDVKSNETLDFVVELNGRSGSEIGFKFVDVNSTAKDVDFKGAETTMYRTTNYQVASIELTNTYGTSNVDYKLGEKNEYEFGKFNIANVSTGSEDKDIVLKSLTLRNRGTADLSMVLDNVKVTRDGKNVAKKVMLEGRDMIIYFDNNELLSGKKGIFTILAGIKNLDRTGDTIQLELNKNTDLVAYEKNSNFRVSYNNMTTSVKLKSYTLDGGKLVFVNMSNFPKVVEAGQGSNDIVIAEGSLNVSEPVKLTNVTVTPTSTGDAKAVIKKLVLEIGNSNYTLDRQANGTYAYADDIYVSKKSTVRLLVSLNSTIPSSINSLQFKQLNGSSFTNGEYEQNGDYFTPSNNIAGIIQVAKLVVKTPTFSITNNASSTQKVVLGNADVVTIFDGNITTNRGKMSVNELVLTGTYSKALQTGDQVSLTVYVNDKAFSNVIYDKGNQVIVLNNLGDISKDDSIKLKIDAQSSMTTTGDLSFNVSAMGTDENGNQTEATGTRTAKLDIVESSQITIANSNASSTVVRDGSNAELLKFSTNVKNGQASLSNIELTLSGDNKALTGKVVSVTINGSKYESDKVTANKITFKNMNENLSLGNHVFEFTANVDSEDALTGSDVIIKEVKLTYDNGKVAKKELNVTYMFVKAFPTLSLVKNDNNELVVRITNPENSDETLTVAGFKATGAVNTASLNNQTIATGGAIEAAKQVSLSAGDSTELKLGVSNGTVQLTSITVKFSDSNKDYVYAISDKYTNVAKWGDLKVIYKS